MLPEDADAQRRRKKKKKKKKKAKTEQKATIPFKDRLWYGAGGTLNFGSSQDISSFTIGLFPMVGYKFNNWFSVGPRIEAAATLNRYDLRNILPVDEITQSNTFDYGAGIFARTKSPFGIYGHFEYFVRNDQFEINTNSQRLRLDGTDFPQVNLDDNSVAKIREVGSSFLIGAGYNSSGFSKFGYEIQLNYDLLAPEDTVNIPINIRFGLTYNF